MDVGEVGFEILSDRGSFLREEDGFELLVAERVIKRIRDFIRFCSGQYIANCVPGAVKTRFELSLAVAFVTQPQDFFVVYHSGIPPLFCRTFVRNLSIPYIFDYFVKWGSPPF